MNILCRSSVRSVSVPLLSVLLCPLPLPLPLLPRHLLCLYTDYTSERQREASTGTATSSLLLKPPCGSSPAGSIPRPLVYLGYLGIWATSYKTRSRSCNDTTSDCSLVLLSSLLMMMMMGERPIIMRQKLRRKIPRQIPRLLSIPRVPRVWDPQCRRDYYYYSASSDSSLSSDSCYTQCLCPEE